MFNLPKSAEKAKESKLKLPFTKMQLFKNITI
jgi:hypothetical protein